MYAKEYVSNYSRFLIRLAWSVEIIAVLIGLTISIVVAVAAYNSNISEDQVNLLDTASAIAVSALPFVLIAVVETCKIPLTFAFMSVRNVPWRLMFLIFVLFLCSITFETMLNGFERNFANLNRAIDSRKNDIENANSEIALLENRRNHVVKFTEEELLAEIEANRSEVDSGYRQAIQRIDTKTKAVITNIDYSFKEKLEAEITRLENVRDGYYQNWRAETQSVEERFSTLLMGNISGSADERERLLGELKTLKAEFTEAMASANFFTRANREAKYRALIKEKEDQLAQITTGYLGGDAIEKQSTMEAQLKMQLEFVNKKYSGRVADLNNRIEGLKQEIKNRLNSNAKLKNNLESRSSADKARFTTIRKMQKEEIDQYFNNKLTELEQINERAFEYDEKIFTINNTKRELQSEINHLINQNQIYRLAMYWDGKESATEVKRTTVGLIALLWFGSLSLITAICGVMLALAGFYLKRFTEPEEAST